MSQRASKGQRHPNQTRGKDGRFAVLCSGCGRKLTDEERLIAAIFPLGGRTCEECRRGERGRP